MSTTRCRGGKRFHHALHRTAGSVKVGPTLDAFSSAANRDTATLCLSLSKERMLGEHSIVIGVSFPAEFDLRSHLFSPDCTLLRSFPALSSLSDNGRMFIALYLCQVSGVVIRTQRDAYSE